jgi:hypothetical protein
VHTARDRGTRIGEEQAERNGTESRAQQGPQPQPDAAEQDEQRTRGPDGEVNGVRDKLRGLLGQARSAQVGREEPRDAQDDPRRQQRRADQAGPGTAERGLSFRQGSGKPGVIRYF